MRLMDAFETVDFQVSLKGHPLTKVYDNKFLLNLCNKTGVYKLEMKMRSIDALVK